MKNKKYLGAMPYEGPGDFSFVPYPETTQEDEVKEDIEIQLPNLMDELIDKNPQHTPYSIKKACFEHFDTYSEWCLRIKLNPTTGHYEWRKFSTWVMPEFSNSQRIK